MGQGAGTPTITHTSPGAKLKLTNLHSSAVQYNLALQTSYLYQAGTNFQTSSPMTFTTDGKGTYHGILSAEKTGEVVKNTNVMVVQKNTGSTSVGLVSYSSQSAKLNIASTGGTTAITLKGNKGSTAFDIFVDSVNVATVTSQSDGTLSLEGHMARPMCWRSRFRLAIRTLSRRRCLPVLRPMERPISRPVQSSIWHSARP
jgi:hypothetical protein